MVNGDGLSYYFDGHHLFVKLVDPGNQETQARNDCDCDMPPFPLARNAVTQWPSLTRQRLLVKPAEHGSKEAQASQLQCACVALHDSDLCRTRLWGTVTTPAPHLPLLTSAPLARSVSPPQGIDFCRGGVCVRGYRYWSLYYSIKATTLSCGGAFCWMQEQVGEGQAGPGLMLRGAGKAGRTLLVALCAPLLDVHLLICSSALQPTNHACSGMTSPTPCPAPQPWCAALGAGHRLRAAATMAPHLLVPPPPAPTSSQTVGARELMVGRRWRDGAQLLALPVRHCWHACWLACCVGGGCLRRPGANWTIPRPQYPATNVLRFPMPSCGRRHHMRPEEELGAVQRGLDEAGRLVCCYM